MGQKFNSVNDLVLGLSEKETILAWLHDKDNQIAGLEFRIKAAVEVLTRVKCSCDDTPYEGEDHRWYCHEGYVMAINQALSKLRGEK